MKFKGIITMIILSVILIGLLTGCTMLTTKNMKMEHNTNSISLNGTITVIGNHVHAVAGEKQLELLNQLRGTDISFGELIKKVFPRVVKYIPKNAFKLMESKKMIWIPTNTDNLPKQGISVASPQNYNQLPSFQEMPLITLAHYSYVDVHPSNLPLNMHSSVDFGSFSWETSPSQPIPLPYMSILTQLEESGQGIVASDFESDIDVSSIQAYSTLFDTGAGNYRTTGTHYGMFPSGYTPPDYYFVTYSPWQTIPYSF